MRNSFATSFFTLQVCRRFHMWDNAGRAGQTDVPDAGVRAGELLTHIVGVAAVVVEDDAVEF